MGCPFHRGEASGAVASPDVVAPPSLRATPGPTGVVRLDDALDPIAFLGGLIREHGDVIRYRTRMGECFLFTHPDHVQTILQRENYRRASLVKMMLGEGVLAIDGPRWRSQRKLMQRDFQPARIAPFADVMTRETSRLERDWHAAARDGSAVDVTAAMTRLTLRIIVDALFSDGLNDDAATHLCAAVTQTITDLGRISRTIFGVPVQFTPDSNAAFNAGKRVIDATCYDLIARRRCLPTEQHPRDLLTLLIEAETDDGPMTDKQVRDELVTMLIGGHETTALALAWAWKAIADDLRVEATLHRELDAVLDGRSPTVDDVPALPYARAVFQETLRLYPPVWYMAKVASEADVIDGHAIPKNACVLVSAWFTHRHPAFWPDAERFDPARFLNGATPTHRHAFFPFGGGRHLCLGMHIANLEATLILAQLAQQFRVRPIAGQHVVPDAGITLRQSPLMLATIEARADRPALANTEAA